MKVHYRKRITDQIRNEITKAYRQDREVETIELNGKEWMRLKHELAAFRGSTQGQFIRKFQTQIEFMGVTVVKEGAVEIDDDDEEF